MMLRCVPVSTVATATGTLYFKLKLETIEVDSFNSSLDGELYYSFRWFSQKTVGVGTRDKNE